MAEAAVQCPTFSVPSSVRSSSLQPQSSSRNSQSQNSVSKSSTSKTSSGASSEQGSSASTFSILEFLGLKKAAPETGSGVTTDPEIAQEQGTPVDPQQTEEDGSPELSLEDGEQVAEPEKKGILSLLDWIPWMSDSASEAEEEREENGPGEVWASSSRRPRSSRQSAVSTAAGTQRSVEGADTEDTVAVEAADEPMPAASDNALPWWWWLLLLLVSAAGVLTGVKLTNRMLKGKDDDQNKLPR